MTSGDLYYKPMAYFKEGILDETRAVLEKVAGSGFKPPTCRVWTECSINWATPPKYRNMRKRKLILVKDATISKQFLKLEWLKI